MKVRYFAALLFFCQQNHQQNKLTFSVEVAQTSQKLQVFDSVGVAQTIVANIRAMGETKTLSTL